ncbi:hypothetical protein L873DRAFT_1820441 [Choiromyces venosus 120613-1]|uniref:Uncharacterized protein n=1 Tax=Choiromyces venosus 120613-1 TaxID=1336337 RepID=A0A3N4IXB2_9PEZI|nr:hypothetical protein L873DRAFT_1820441 [Choiromyces venosus 120613-1]
MDKSSKMLVVGVGRSGNDWMCKILQDEVQLVCSHGLGYVRWMHKNHSLPTRLRLKRIGVI